MTKNKENRAAELRAELAELEKDENEQYSLCLSEVMKLPEIKQLKKLCTISGKKTITVPIKINYSFIVSPFIDGSSWFEVPGGYDGWISVEPVLPKEYNINTYCGSTEDEPDGLDGSLVYLSKKKCLTPEIRKDLENLKLFQKKLWPKIEKIVKQYNVDFENVLCDLSDMILDQI